MIVSLLKAETCPRVSSEVADDIRDVTWFSVCGIEELELVIMYFLKAETCSGDISENYYKLGL